MFDVQIHHQRPNDEDIALRIGFLFGQTLYGCEQRSVLNEMGNSTGITNTEENIQIEAGLCKIEKEKIRLYT